MAKDQEAKSAEVVTLPPGRVINQSLWTKDQFNEQSTPKYKVEVAFPKDSDAEATIEDLLLDAANERWGKGTEDDPHLRLPLLDGDKLAKKREKKGKDGDAYKGMVVIRADTVYNRDGDDGPGGVAIYDEDVEDIEAANKAAIYNGCYGRVAVVIGAYEWEDDEGDKHPALKFYLSAFQKTGDGEKLVSSADKSTLFKPVGREKRKDEGEGRRRRRG